MDFKEKQMNSTLIYDCFFMKLYEDDVLLPDGNQSKRVYVKHDGASAILPITKEGNILLIKQYRYPIQQVSIEIPAGKKDSQDEDGLLCAKRELEEETGYRSENIKKISSIFNCVGYSNEKIELFIAHDCEKVENPLSMDEDEFIELMTVTVEESKILLQNGIISDSKTIIALQHYFLNTGLE
jgi:ADP-ribose pyrophosphatase